MAGFTPGPLQVASDPFDNQDYKVIVEVPGIAGSLGTEVARCEHNWNDHTAGDRRISWAEAEANARLYAASPELLEALEEAAARFALIKDKLNSGDLQTGTQRASFANDVWHMECEARTAIAKAKGES